MLPFRTMKFRRLILAVSVCATAGLAAGCAGSITPGATPDTTGSSSGKTVSPDAGNFKFRTINNGGDPTFNQLLGINKSRVISGYFGSGASASHPNKGYTVTPPYGQANFTDENYPGSVQTQVTCIDDPGNTAGFWVDAQGVNRGFIAWNGVFTSYAHPKAKGVTQILGLNASGIAVGFYVDKKGVNHGFTLNQASGKFTPVIPPGGSNVTASGINNNGDITGFYSSGSQTVGFLEKASSFSTFSFPQSPTTTPFGINNKDDIVGSYVQGSATHGFLLKNPLHQAKFQSIDDPKGIGTTTINGLNDRLNMVGFYVDSAGNTDGMLIQRK